MAPGAVAFPAVEPFEADRVATVRIVMSEEDWQACCQSANREEYVRADFWYGDELVADVGVRPKGNSSLRAAVWTGSPRIALKVDFNLFNSARTFRGLKKLNYSNGFSDPTLIRETLAYELFDWIGLPTPRTSFVDLWVNDTHLGLYTQVEQIDRGFLDEHFPGTSGDLYKPEPPAGLLDWTEEDYLDQAEALGLDLEEEMSVMDVNLGGGRLGDIVRILGEDVLLGYIGAGEDTPSPDETPGGQHDVQTLVDKAGLKTNEGRSDHSALFRFLDVLNNEPDESFPEEIEEVLDVDSVLRFLAVSSVLVHLDNYIGMGHNYYLYEVDGRFSIMPWDLNEAFGVFTMGIDRDGIINFYVDEPTTGPVAERPLVARLLAHEPYLERYHEYLEALLDGPFKYECMSERIDACAKLIRPYVVKDDLKFYPTEAWEQGLSDDVEVQLIGSPGAPGQGFQAPALEAPPPLPPAKLGCLRQTFPKAVLEQLRDRPPTTQEKAKLEACLTPEEIAALLAFLRGTGDEGQPAAETRERTVVGLKTFVQERAVSIREQLAGLRPSDGDGKGNGARGMGMPAGGVPGRPAKPPPGGGRNG